VPRKIPQYKKPSLPRAEPAQESKPAPRPAGGFYNLRAWRGSENKKGVRDLQLEAEPLCKICKDEGRLTQATDVHHHVKVKDDAGLALDMGNLWSLCKQCHDRISGWGQ
jgi:5-methylcytosine-specific restriction endonuclease McrA